MRIERGLTYAVVTGDLIGSTKMPLDLRRSFHHLVDRASNELREFLGDGILGVDLFSGDSWQFVSIPRLSLWACLFLRAYIRAHMDGADTRCVVGIGTIDFVPNDRVSQGDGEAFRLSGRLLEQIKKSGSAMRIAAADPQIVQKWDLPFALADAVIVSSWTRRRALALTGQLRGWNQEETGRLWENFCDRKKPVSQGTISTYLEQANWSVFSQFLQEFEDFWV